MESAQKCTYRWLVLMVTTICHGLSWGFLYSVGVLYKDWVRYFDSPASYVSFAGSLPTAVGCVAGPTYGLLINKLGLRKCGIAGGILAVIGVAASSLVESVFFLLITYGLLTGFGMGLSIFSASAMINDYFIQDRMLAEGIFGGGLCVGNFLLSLFVQFLSNTYSWKGAMLITGGMCFHLTLIAMFYIPSRNISEHPLNFWKRCDSMENRKSQARQDNNANLPKPFLEASFSKKEDSPNDVEESGDKQGFFRRSYMLYQNPIFLVIISADFLTFAGSFIPYIHLVERGRQEGMDEDTASWLSAIMGLSGIVGRPLAGFICNRFHFHPLWSFCVVQITSGIATILSSFWSDVLGFFLFAAVYGFLSIGYGFIKASTAYLLDPNRFVDAYSWLMLFEGIGAAIGPFLAGVIRDSSQSYSWSFRYSGFMLILSGFICLLVPVIQHTPKKRRNGEEIIRDQTNRDLRL